MKRIRVPEEMLKAALDAKQMPHRREYEETVRPALEAALRWLSEYPQVPTEEQCRNLIRDYARNPHGVMKEEGCVPWCVVEWQRRCFVQEEPEIPEEIKDLLIGAGDYPNRDSTNAQIIEAYRRGLRKGEGK